LYGLISFVFKNNERYLNLMNFEKRLLLSMWPTYFLEGALSPLQEKNLYFRLKGCIFKGKVINFWG